VGPRLLRQTAPEGAVEIRVRGRPDVVLPGRLRTVLPAGLLDLPSAALGYAAGGSTAIVAGDQSGTRTVEPFFEARVDFVDPAQAAALLCSGQRVEVRFDFGRRPLFVQWWRATRQLVQRRFAV
jgi:putative peptide zinc metalloprotease protein